MTVRASRQPSTSLKPNFPDPTGSPTETLRGLHPFAPLPLQGFLRAPTSWTSATLTRPPTWSGGLGWRTGFASLILVLVGASATLAPDSRQCLINTKKNRIGRTHDTGGKYVIPPPFALPRPRLSHRTYGRTLGTVEPCCPKKSWLRTVACMWRCSPDFFVQRRRSLLVYRCDSRGPRYQNMRDTGVYVVNKSGIVSVRFSQEELEMLHRNRMVTVSTGLEMELPLASLIRQLAIAGCQRIEKEKNEKSED